jgi:hypothetical protein
LKTHTSTRSQVRREIKKAVADAFKSNKNKKQAKVSPTTIDDDDDTIQQHDIPASSTAGVDTKGQAHRARNKKASSPACTITKGRA